MASRERTELEVVQTCPLIIYRLGLYSCQPNSYYVRPLSLSTSALNLVISP